MPLFAGAAAAVCLYATTMWHISLLNFPYLLGPPPPAPSACMLPRCGTIHYSISPIFWGRNRRRLHLCSQDAAAQLAIAEMGIAAQDQWALVVHNVSALCHAEVLLGKMLTAPVWKSSAAAGAVARHSHTCAVVPAADVVDFCSFTISGASANPRTWILWFCGRGGLRFRVFRGGVLGYLGLGL